MKGGIEPPARPFVMCVGSAALDLVMDLETLPPEDGRVASRTAILAGGGPAATAAVTMRRLGTRVAFVGSVGTDDAGQLIRDGLVREDVDVSWLASVEGTVSAMSAGLVRSSHGTRTLAAFRGSGAEIAVTLEVEALAREASWIHADHAGFDVVRELRRRGVDTPVSVDGGNAIADLDLTLVDLYAPATPELLRWTGASTLEDGLRQAYHAGVPIALVTHGAAGSTALSAVRPEAADLTAELLRARDLPRPAEPWSTWQPAFPVEGSGSTLGAGDVFHGALLAAIVAGSSLEAAMTVASAAAALSCRAIDGRSAIPTSAEIDRLIEARPGDHARREASWC
jgi:sulfofructose kinase